MTSSDEMFTRETSGGFVIIGCGMDAWMWRGAADIHDRYTWG